MTDIHEIDETNTQLLNFGFLGEQVWLGWLLLHLHAWSSTRRPLIHPEKYPAATILRNAQQHSRSVQVLIRKSNQLHALDAFPILVSAVLGKPDSQLAPGGPTHAESVSCAADDSQDLYLRGGSQQPGRMRAPQPVEFETHSQRPPPPPPAASGHPSTCPAACRGTHSEEASDEVIQCVLHLLAATAAGVCRSLPTPPPAHACASIVRGLRDLADGEWDLQGTGTWQVIALAQAVARCGRALGPHVAQRVLQSALHSVVLEDQSRGNGSRVRTFGTALQLAAGHHPDAADDLRAFVACACTEELWAAFAMGLPKQRPCSAAKAPSSESQYVPLLLMTPHMMDCAAV